MVIYLTYCSWQKDDKYRETGIQTTPDKLYTSPRIQNFIEVCRDKDLNWAIFSDLYGVCFPDEVQHWYDKSPDEVTFEEYLTLVDNFNQKLSRYSEIVFYYDENTFHELYRKVLSETNLSKKIKKITDLAQI